MNQQAKDRVKAARAWLLREHIWIGAMSLRFELEETTNPRVTYMGTDGERLLYNAKRILAEPVEMIAGVIAHEVAHCALGHFARREDRDFDDWNIAGDYAANQLLTDAEIAIPKEGLLSPKYNGWSAERIYRDIHDRPKTEQEKKGGGAGLVLDAGDGEQPQQQPGQGDPFQNDVRKTMRDAAAAELAKEWMQAAAEAQQVATVRGNMPGELAKALARAREPQQDWRALLRQYAVDPTTGDYRFSPPNRRHIWRGAYLPGVRAHQVGTMIMAIDTSGSVLNEIETFKAEGVSMLESGIIGELVIIACDAKAHLLGRFHKGMDIEWPKSLPGGGGTDFAPVFEMVEKLGISPTCCAYLTDLMGGFPDQEPGYPTLWVTTCPGTAPFGTVVEMR